MTRETEPTEKRRPGLETRSVLVGCGLAVAVWLIVLAGGGLHIAGWVGLGLAVGLMLLFSLQHVMVFRPLRRRLRDLRDAASAGDLGDDTATRVDDDLASLLESALLVSGDGTDTTLRRDLDRLEKKNRQLVEVADIGRELNAALPYRETVERALERRDELGPMGLAARAHYRMHHTHKARVDHMLAAVGITVA